MTSQFNANFIYFNFDINYFFQKIKNSGVIERKRKKDRKIVFFTHKLKFFERLSRVCGGGRGLAQ